MMTKATIHQYLKQQKSLYGSELYLSQDPVPTPVVEATSNPEMVADPANGLDKYNKSICECMECPLGSTRTNFVFGVGDMNADLMLVGEAPGQQEDLKGEPFVGRAGKLLDDILRAINLKRGQGVYIANVLKCRPPNNRDPLPSEVEKCEPYLQKQIRLIQPKLIVALGRVAGKTLLK